MSNIIEILAYDDVPKNIGYLNQAWKELDLPGFSLCASRVNSKEKWIQAAEEINNKTGDFILLLDLGFRKEGVPIWENVKQAFSISLFDGTGCRLDENGDLVFPYDGSPMPIPEAALDGLALLVESMENNSEGRTLVYIASGRGNIGSLQYFLTFLSKLKPIDTSPRKFIFARDTDGANVTNRGFAKDILGRLTNRWKQSFPEFHTDPWINHCVSQWFLFYRELKGRKDQKKFCQHGIDSSDKWTIEGSPSDYEILLAEMFGVNRGDLHPRDMNGVKALLSLDKSPSDAIPSEQWFKEWKSDKPESGGKPISQSFLTTILKAVFGCDVDVVPNEARLPLVPALPFLLSLRVLVQALRDHDGGMFAEGTKIVLKGSDGAYRLSIPLVQDERKRFGLAKRWVDKRESGGTPITSDGVCGALWRASLAKIEVIDKAAQDDVEKALLHLFDGPGRPVVGVSFAPHFIYLYWS